MWKVATCVETLGTYTFGMNSARPRQHINIQVLVASALPEKNVCARSDDNEFREYYINHHRPKHLAFVLSAGYGVTFRM